MRTLGIRIWSFVALALSLGLASPSFAVPPTLAAEQLLDHGEAKYPTLFAGHPLTQDYGPFRYRAYANGLLLGVVVSTDSSYVIGGVYAMGGAFGNGPTLLGQVSDFITPTDGISGPMGTSNGCVDLNWKETAGASSSVTFQLIGSSSGTQTQTTLVSNTTVFEGYNAIETIVRTTGTLIYNGTSSPVDTETRTFAKRTGPAEITHYGTVGTSSNSSTFMGASYQRRSTSTTRNMPPSADRWYGLAVGASTTQLWARHTASTFEETVASPGATPVTSTEHHAADFSGSTTTRYVGREWLTVPAGTYDTCRFENMNNPPGNGEVHTSWLIYGVGLLIKSSFAIDGIPQISQATSIKLNGQNL